VKKFSYCLLTFTTIWWTYSSYLCTCMLYEPSFHYQPLHATVPYYSLNKSSHCPWSLSSTTLQSRLSPRFSNSCLMLSLSKKFVFATNNPII
jgi:hypothetical protein